MRAVSFVVEWEKKVSDGAYGNEGGRVSLTVELEDDETWSDRASIQLATCRQMVLQQLSRSNVLAVRRKVEMEIATCLRCSAFLADNDDNGYCAACMAARDREQTERLANGAVRSHGEDEDGRSF